MARSADKAYEIIRKDILTGKYPPEFHLIEASIAKNIGISRTPVREALRRLASDGYVEFRPNQGAFVAPWSPASFMELISVRAELAAMAARGAALHAAGHHFRRLDEIVAEMASIRADASHAELDRQTRLNFEFHAVIFENCGNRWVAQLMVQTSHASNMHRAYYAFAEYDWRIAVERYKDVVTALRQGDGEWAAAVFKSHFLASRNTVVRWMKDRVAAERDIAAE